MALSEEEEVRMYRDTIKTATIVSQLQTRLEKGDIQIESCNKRLNDLEIEHSLLKGKLGAFILGLTFIVSLLVNGILWAWSHIGGK